MIKALLTKHAEPSDDWIMEIGANSQPMTIFSAWMEEAKAHPGIKEPSAMSVATVGAGDLHSRVVLCRAWSDAGFMFFTNYNSVKGQDLARDPRVAAVFYWDPMFRQVCISGRAKKTSRADSQTYWKARPRDNQLSQFISRQSETVASREDLEAAWTKANKDFAGREVPCPEHWGGYLIEPSKIEFWVGHTGRLHDRYQFEKSASAWTFRRLCP